MSMSVCVCVCVCEREREKERGRIVPTGYFIFLRDSTDSYATGIEM